MAGLALANHEIQDISQPGCALDRVEGYDALAKAMPDGSCALSVLVEGARCAGCISKIEAHLAKAGARAARLNFTTRRLNIEWQGAAGRANDFVNAVQALGYRVYPYEAFAGNQAEQEEENFLLLCLGVAGFAAGNIMLLSVGLWTADQQTMGVEARDFMHLMSALIALPAVLFSGRPFFRSAFRALSHRTTNMDVPISVALVLTSLMSLFEAFRHGEHAYFDSVVMLMFFLLIGRYLDFRARRQARSAASELLSGLGGFASVIGEDGSIRMFPVSALAPGMNLRVAAGDKIPADGVVLQGRSEIDMSLVTGETVPQDAREGARVYAGTINISAPLIVRATKAADDTLLSDIARLMEKAEQSQARYVRIADRAARLYAPVVHILAAVSLVAWIVTGLAWQKALLIAATVLIITCPCALALAAPVAQVLAISRLMKRRVLVKSGDALERLAGIDTILLDKTGTLTLGQPALVGSPDAESLKIAASLASFSSHPLSKALRRAYHGPLLGLEDVREYPGMGLEARHEGIMIRLGRGDWRGDEPQKSGGMELWLWRDGASPQEFHFSDKIRADGRETIERLKKRGLDIVLISGDRKEPVREMAAAAGIEKFHARMTPVEKVNLLDDLKRQGRRVLMAGDGLNDAPALAGADVSISPATASDLAQNAADIVFMGEGLGSLLTAYDTAVFTQRLVKQNFALTISYNILAIPLAMAGYVTPLSAALAMSGSSLAVVANAFRLRWRKD